MKTICEEWVILTNSQHWLPCKCNIHTNKTHMMTVAEISNTNTMSTETLMRILVGVLASVIFVILVAICCRYVNSPFDQYAPWYVASNIWKCPSWRRPRVMVSNMISICNSLKNMISGGVIWRSTWSFSMYLKFRGQDQRVPVGWLHKTNCEFCRLWHI